jgi:hypothetical protein
MLGSPSSIIMRGLGNGTFLGSPSLILTLGYGSNGTTPVEEVDIFQVSLSIENRYAGTSAVGPKVFGYANVEANPDV